MWYEKACFIMSIDFMNMSYENSMIMKHEFHYFSIYVYVCFKKRYNDFKGSQMAMNESLREGRHPELASTRNMALPAGIKLAHELRTLSIKKHGPVTGIIVTLARISVSNVLKHDMNTWWKWFTIHDCEIYMIYACMMSL